MSTDRKEPTLSNLDSTNASKQSQRATTQPSSQGGSQPHPKQKRSANTQVVVKKQSSSLLWLAFLTALLGLALAAYGFWQLQQAQISLLKEQQRINGLEQKLALSGDESSQSLTVLTASLRELKQQTELAMSEIDKLWATRNVNKKAIEDNKKQHEGALTKTNKLVSALEASVKATGAPVKALQQSKLEQELLLQSLRERFAEQEKTLDNVSQRISGLAAKKQLQVLQQEINTNKEAVKAFDKFRVTVNRDLLSLKERASPRPVTPR